MYSNTGNEILKQLTHTPFSKSQYHSLLCQLIIAVFISEVFQDVLTGSDSRDISGGHLQNCPAGVLFSAEPVFVGPALRYFTSSNFNLFSAYLPLPERAEVDTVSPLLGFRSQQLSRQNCIFESETGENKHM